MKKIPHPVIKQISETRRSAGISQKLLAIESGLTQAHLSDLERGGRPNPRFDTVLALQSALARLESNMRTQKARPHNGPLPGILIPHNLRGVLAKGVSAVLAIEPGNADAKAAQKILTPQGRPAGSNQNNAARMQAIRERTKRIRKME